MISTNLVSRFLAICILGLIVFFAGRFFWQQSQNAQFTDQAVNLSVNDVILSLKQDEENNSFTPNKEIDDLAQRAIDEQLLDDNLLNELKEKNFNQDLFNDFAINLSAYRAALESNFELNLFPDENAKNNEENTKKELNTQSSLNLAPVPLENPVEPENSDINKIKQEEPSNKNYKRAIPPGDISQTLPITHSTKLERHFTSVNNYYNQKPDFRSVEIWNGIMPENQNYEPEYISQAETKTQNINAHAYNTSEILPAEGQNNRTYSQVTEGGSSPASYTIATVQGPIKDIVYELNSVAVSQDGSEARVLWKVKNNSPYAIKLDGALKQVMSAERTKIIDFFTQKSFPVKWNRQIPAANCLLATQIPAYGRIDCSALLGPVLERNSVIESNVVLVKLPGAKYLTRVNLNV